jgi:hypothetical protein
VLLSETGSDHLHVIAEEVSRVAEPCIGQDMGTVNAATAFTEMETGSVNWFSFANVASFRGLSHFYLRISSRIRHQIRCAVCRCFRGACLSASRTASMNAIAGSSFGLSRTGVLRSTGTALSTASRTIRR